MSWSNGIAFALPRHAVHTDGPEEQPAGTVGCDSALNESDAFTFSPEADRSALSPRGRGRPKPGSSAVIWVVQRGKDVSPVGSLSTARFVGPGAPSGWETRYAIPD